MCSIDAEAEIPLNHRSKEMFHLLCLPACDRPSRSDFHQILVAWSMLIVHQTRGCLGKFNGPTGEALTVLTEDVDKRWPSSLPHTFASAESEA
jgi:hypothetical protein